MATAMRAKMKVQSVEKCEGWENLKLAAVIGGSAEDNSFANATPSANLSICITNAALLGKFEPGKAFYVDFTPAE